MSFLKQILSPFVEFTDDKKPKPEKENSVPKAVPPEPLTNNPPAAANAIEKLTIPTPSYTLPPEATTMAPLPEHQKHFEDLIEKANAEHPLFQGTDYKEFIDAKIDIDAIEDEEKKYKTAFNVLKRTGLTKDKLITTGQEYINLIGRELNSFQGTHVQQYQKEVNQREALIEKKAQELQALREKMAALQTDIKQISQEITQKKEQLNQSRNSFLLAGENKQREIYNELTKIASFF